MNGRASGCARVGHLEGVRHVHGEGFGKKSARINLYLKGTYLQFGFIVVKVSGKSIKKRLFACE